MKAADVIEGIAYGLFAVAGALVLFSFAALAVLFWMNYVAGAL